MGDHRRHELIDLVFGRTTSSSTMRHRFLILISVGSPAVVGCVHNPDREGSHRESQVSSAKFVLSGFSVDLIGYVTAGTSDV
jgi:hypothetical protein